MKRVQLFNGRYTKGVPFVKNSIYKGKGLDLGAKPLRTKLYWVASHPPRLLPRAFHKLQAEQQLQGARSSPLGGRWWAQDAAGLLGQRVFWTKFKMAHVDSHLTDTSVGGEERHSTISMAHTRIFTRLLKYWCVVFTHTFFGFNCGLWAPDGGQSYLATLITLRNCTKLRFYSLPGAIYI